AITVELRGDRGDDHGYEPVSFALRTNRRCELEEFRKLRVVAGRAGKFARLTHHPERQRRVGADGDPLAQDLDRIGEAAGTPLDHAAEVEELRAPRSVRVRKGSVDESTRAISLARRPGGFGRRAEATSLCRLVVAEPGGTLEGRRGRRVTASQLRAP